MELSEENFQELVNRALGAGEGGRLSNEQRDARQRLLGQEAIAAYLKAADDPQALRSIMSQAVYSRRLGEKMLSAHIKLKTHFLERAVKLKEEDLPKAWSKEYKTQVLDFFRLLYSEDDQVDVEIGANDDDFSPEWKTLEELSEDYRRLKATAKKAKKTSTTPLRSSEIVKEAMELIEGNDKLKEFLDVSYSLAIDGGGNKQRAASIVLPKALGGVVAGSFEAPPRASLLTALTFPEWCLALLKLLVKLVVDSKPEAETVRDTLKVRDARILGEKAKSILQAGTVSAREQEFYHFIESTQMDVWQDLNDAIRVIVFEEDLPEDASYVRRWRKMLLVDPRPLSLLHRLNQSPESFRTLVVAAQDADAAPEAALERRLMEQAHAFALNTRGVDSRLLREGRDGRAALLMEVLRRDDDRAAGGGGGDGGEPSAVDAD
jgi:hypothetical protein